MQNPRFHFDAAFSVVPILQQKATVFANENLLALMLIELVSQIGSAGIVPIR